MARTSRRRNERIAGQFEKEKGNSKISRGRGNCVEWNGRIGRRHWDLVAAIKLRHPNISSRDWSSAAAVSSSWKVQCPVGSLRKWPVKPTTSDVSLGDDFVLRRVNKDDGLSSAGQRKFSSTGNAGPSNAGQQFFRRPDIPRFRPKCFHFLGEKEWPSAIYD